ncbi:uncharacterized protein LOC126972311 isoform X3 [Leptidea sinapis]|uniref:uncharacterized protein LOC126972311 isoform X3 n=1 Tax=Leptidea sinapis TaxID=189913 RepID=UPI0021371AF3|nr:uncharacterized protein LOC126972311 isoform X3 [Leptidea sinapis]
MADGITNEELEKEISKILQDANLAETSTRKVVQKLEEIFDTDLSDKKKVIDQLVMDYVNGQESESEEEKKPVKKAAKPKKARKQSSDEEEEEDGSNECDSEEEKKPVKKSKKKDDDDYKKPAKRAARPAKKARKASSDEDEDASEDSDSEEDKKPAKKKSAAKGSKAKGGKGGGYTRPLRLSPALSELMGAESMPRHEVVKQVWNIIKTKNLYDPNNKQFAICDDALYKVIGTKRFRTFGMMKYLKTHFLD